MTKTAADTRFKEALTTLLQEHTAPWSYREESEGQPVPFHYQEEPDVRTDDARRRHVVRDASGGPPTKVTDLLRTVADFGALLEAAEQRPGKRRPYKRRVAA